VVSYVEHTRKPGPRFAMGAKVRRTVILVVFVVVVDQAHCCVAPWLLFRHAHGWQHLHASRLVTQRCGRPAAAAAASLCLPLCAPRARGGFLCALHVAHVERDLFDALSSTARPRIAAIRTRRLSTSFSTRSASHGLESKCAVSTRLHTEHTAERAGAAAREGRVWQS
jgi:hypothetical protein